MCNCYYARCERCERQSPIHLADFVIEPGVVKADPSARHIPKEDVAVFEVTEPSRHDWPLRKGTRVGFRYQMRKFPLRQAQDIARCYSFEDFYPNICSGTTLKVIGNPLVGRR